MSQGGDGGIGLGCVIAAVVSWSANHDVWWAIVHGVCGWLYLVYWAIFV